MIVAIILCDRTQPLIQGSVPYLLPMGKDERVIERAASVVLRGPFGGTVVASASAIQGGIREALHGFALQHVTLSANAVAGTIGALAQALKFAQDFRTRWQKAMAAAAERFGPGDDDDEDERESEQPKNSKKKGADWARHSRSADVKVRGLARSFERDGVILFRGDSPLITPELQAHVVEAFAREAAGIANSARPFAQAVHGGVRGYPIAIDQSAVGEVSALPRHTIFDDWLLSQLSRVQDVPVQEAGAVERIASEADYTRLCKAK